MLAVVFIEGWQQECCGEPFRVGSRVRWSVSDAVDTAHLALWLGAATAARVTHVEDHHDMVADVRGLAGTVERIEAAHCRYQQVVHHSDGRVSEPVPGTCRLTEVPVGSRHEHGSEDDERWLGYLVLLRCDDSA